MNCRSVHRWLLDVDTAVVKDWPRDMNRHLKRCAGCALLARDMFKLEDVWRKLPVPELCARSKAAFLDKLADPVKSKEFEIPEEVTDPEELRELEEAQKSGTIRPPTKRAMAKSAKKAKQARKAMETASPWRPWPWVPFAAVVLIAIGLLIYMFIAPNHAPTSAEILDRIVAWNARLSNTSDLQERNLLLNDFEPSVRMQINRAVLTPDEREHAEDLLNTGRQLAFSPDPLSDADLVFSIQSKLLTHAVSAERSGNTREVDRRGARYSRFTEMGVIPTRNRAEVFVAGDAKTKGVGKGDPGDKTGAALGQRLRWETILNRAPEFARPDLHKKFQQHGMKKDSASKR